MNLEMNEFVNRDHQEDKFDNIWLFVEDKLQTSVPTYFKNVLKVCGYNNGISIALIEEADVTYMESEVRDGNVTKALVGIEEKSILEGSYKDKENFEFTMGHRKFLMFIVNFLKTYSAEHGINSFTSEHAVKRSKCKRKVKSSTAVCLNKKMKSSVLESATQITEFTKRDCLTIEKRNLLTKTITSLINLSPEMYVKTCIKDIEMGLTKVSNGLVAIETDEQPDKNSDRVDKFIARIACPFCSKIIPVAHSSAQLANGRLSKPWWNTSNFEDHLKKHQFNFGVEEDDKSSEVLTESSHNTNKVISTKDSKDGNINRKTSIDGNFGGMLQFFMESARRNSNRNKHGYRHDDTTKMFAGYLKMVGGLLAYETLHANFTLSLPSVSTVNRFITDNGPPIIEGEMRVDELLQYLQSRNMPLRISMSEDGTRCTANISYDPKTNQLVGYALPLDTNGMPIVSSFPARNIREIYQHYTNPSNIISSTAYVQMAQPTEPGAPPFCLMMFSTDNKFTALDVYRRWSFQAGKLNEKGIKINNIASDGDPRPLMAMKVLSRIGQSNRSYLDCEWYSCGGYVETTFTQDYVHIITKERNRILKFSRIFPIGDKIISSSHLKYLIDNVSKDKHLLTNSDIEPKDRQNFPSAEKVCSEKTMQCLLDYVPGSEGTVIYLKAMRSVLNAFEKTELTSEERIFLIWYACFFCRAWRSWILNSEKLKMSSKNKPKSYYNLKDNFMSSNCYTCIELNAHALVKKVLVEDEDFNEKSKQSQSSEKSNYFFAFLFDSQVCESIFRQVRSFTSTFCTVVNFTMLDIMNRLRKIQLQNEIINASNGMIKFPRFERKADDMSKSIGQGRQPFNGLNRKTVISQIEKAKDAVIEDLKNIGIDTTKLDLHCQVLPAYEQDLLKSDSDLDCESSSDSENDLQIEFERECYEVGYFNEEDENKDDDKCEELHEDVNFLSGITGELMLKDYTPQLGNSQDGISLDEKSRFVVVVDSTGESKVVRKSAVCYVLSKDKHKLSSDRLQRVQEREYAVDKSSNRTFPDADNFIENQEISIGDWCVFPDCVEKEDERDYDRESNSVLLGLVLGFTYLKGRTFKQREFTRSFASVVPSPEKPVGVLCDLYSFNKFGVLKSVPGYKHKFIKVHHYMGTIRPPIKGSKNLRSLIISQSLAGKLNKIEV